MESASSLDAISSGLLGFGHPLRVRLVVLMDQDEWRPSALAGALGAPLGVSSYHMRMLRDYKLVTMTRTEPRRGALAHFYLRTPLATELLGKLNGSLGVPDPPPKLRGRNAKTEWA